MGSGQTPDRLSRQRSHPLPPIHQGERKGWERSCRYRGKKDLMVEVGDRKEVGRGQVTWGVGHWNSSRTRGLAHFTMLK